MKVTKLCIIVSLFSSVLAFLGCKGKATMQTVSSANTTYGQVDTAKFYPPNSKVPIEPFYSETAKFLWQTYVPKSGQAETLQGELIRAIEKLDNEIRGNAKGNWNEQHVLLAQSLRDALIRSGTFPKEVEDEITNDIRALTRSEEELFMDDDIYDRLTRRIVEWYWRHQEPIKHESNPNLKI